MKIMRVQIVFTHLITFFLKQLLFCQIVPILKYYGKVNGL